jgi:DNA-directed RNA polymerase beta subunit
MNDMLIAKQKVVQTYEEWQSNILERKNLIEQTLKSYKYFDELKKLADNQNVEIQENDIEMHSSELSIYNPDTVSAMLDNLKPKAKETRAEKIARITALNSGVANA